MDLITFPYYHIFRFNTSQPIHLIAYYSSQPDQTHKLLYHIDRWRLRKLQELQYTSIAVSRLINTPFSWNQQVQPLTNTPIKCAILAGAVIGSFSWNPLMEAYWLTPAFWYSSLILSILGVIQSAQQLAVLQLLGPPSSSSIKTDHKDLSERDNIRRYLPIMLSEVSRPPQTDAETLGQEAAAAADVGEWKPRWKMIFTWQCPIMFMSYSVMFFILGLTIFVCTPLVREKEWGTGSNVSNLMGQPASHQSIDYF